MPESKLDSSDSKRSKLFGLLIFLSICFSIFVGLVFFVFGATVEHNQIGLRQNLVSVPGILSKGYESRGLLPGLHWKIPLVSTIHALPRDFQFLHLSNDVESNIENTDYSSRFRELEIPTTDGSKVKTDITLILRLFDKPGETLPPSLPADAKQARDSGAPIAVGKTRLHGGPKDLVNTYSTSRNRLIDLFSRQAEDFLKNYMSRLSTTDFYKPLLRESSAIQAGDQLNQAVNPSGVEVWATMVRRYVYSERNIDDQIFAKNLQEQTERLNAAKSKLEQARAETQDKLAELDAQTMDIKVDGEQKKVVTVSEADRFEAEQQSLGDRLVHEAVAEIDRQRNQVLTETKGAEVYVAREMTPLLRTLRGGVVTNIDPFDVDAWVKKLVAVR